MSTNGTHPTDAMLMMALDRELQAPRRKAVHEHLAVCEACRTRMRALEAGAADSARLCGAGTSMDVAALRTRLRQRMTELRDASDGSLLFRMRRTASSVSLFAQVAIACLLIAVVVRSRNVGGPTVDLRAESLPVSSLTPGAAANIAAADLCSGSAAARPTIPLAVRQRVLRQYRMEDVPASEFELDYLITPELGGVGEARNLWPERYDSDPWNAHIKDDLERLLSQQVCDGSIDLAAAQREIATNWIDAYKKHFATDRPIPRQARIDDDDDEIQFEPPGMISPGAPAVAAFAVDRALPARAARRVLWRW